MHHDPGRPEPAHHPVGQVTGALGGAPRQQHHVAGERLGQPARQDLLVVGADAERHRLAAQLGHRGGQGGGIGIVDRTGPERRAGCDDLVAGGQHRHPWPAIDGDLRRADRRQHGDLARGQHLAGAQHHLAAGDVAASEGDELAGGRRTMDLHHRRRTVVARLGVLHHHHRVGPARQHAARGDHRGRPRLHGNPGRAAGGQQLRVEGKPAGAFQAGPKGVGGAHRKAVDAGAIEAGHIDPGDHVVRHHAPHRLGEWHRFGPERCQAQMGQKACHRRLAVEHVEELLLAGGLADGSVRGHALSSLQSGLPGRVRVRDPFSLGFRVHYTSIPSPRRRTRIPRAPPAPARSRRRAPPTTAQGFPPRPAAPPVRPHGAPG